MRQSLKCIWLQGGVAIYDYNYLVDVMYRSYKEDGDDFLKLDDKELRMKADQDIDFNMIGADMDNQLLRGAGRPS